MSTEQNEIDIIKEGKRGEYKRIPPSMIEADWEQNKRIRPFGHSREQLDRLKDEFLNFGQKEPIVVRKNDKGREKPYKLITGYGRLQIATEINDEWGNTPERVFYLKAIVEEGNEWDAFNTNLTTNAFSAGLSHIEYAYIIRELNDNYGKSDQEIADRFGKSLGWVYQHRSYLRLNHELQKQLHDGTLSTGAALAIVGQDEQTQKEVVKECTNPETGKVNAEEVKETLRKKAAEDRVQRAIDKGTVPAKGDGQTDEEYRAEVAAMLAEDERRVSTPGKKKEQSLRRGVGKVYEFFEGFIMKGPRGACAQVMTQFIDGKVDEKYAFRVFEENVLSAEEFLEWQKYKYNKLHGLNNEYI